MPFAGSFRCRTEREREHRNYKQSQRGIYVLFVGAPGWWITPSVQCFIFDWIVRIIISFRFRCIAIVRFVRILSYICRNTTREEKKKKMGSKSLMVKLFAFHVFRRGKYLLTVVCEWTTEKKCEKFLWYNFQSVFFPRMCVSACRLLSGCCCVDWR